MSPAPPRGAADTRYLFFSSVSNYSCFRLFQQLSFFVESGCKDTTIFQTGKIFFRYFFQKYDLWVDLKWINRNIFFHFHHLPQRINSVISENSDSFFTKWSIIVFCAHKLQHKTLHLNCLYKENGFLSFHSEGALILINKMNFNYINQSKRKNIFEMRTGLKT